MTKRAVALVAALATVYAAMWGLARWRPFEHNRAAIEWPENVAPLVTYLEEISELQFREPINFEFIAQVTEYSDRVRDPAPELSVSALAASDVDEAIGRALGLWTGDASLVETLETVNSASPRPVRWLPDDNLVIVNARDAESFLPASTRADLLVYLTQALIDQNFGIVERLRATATSQEYDAIAALHLGYALWVHDEYVADLGDSDQQSYEYQTRTQSERYSDEVASVPATFRAIRIAFQVLAPTFITALIEQDPALVVQAFAGDFPDALDQISLPTAKYVHDDPVEAVDSPPGPRGASIHYSEQLGPFRLFLMFTTGLPANEALTASDGWGNDRFTAYELNGSECIDVHIVADSPADADRIDRAVNRWAATRPAAAKALVARDGVHLYASVCDPGVDATQAVIADNEIEQYFARADLLRQQAVDTGEPALAECIATDFYARFTVDQIATNSAGVDLEAEFAAIQDDCRSTL